MRNINTKTVPMRNASKRNSRAGYTLVEVMMAIAVMAAGTVGVFSLQQAAVVGNLEARQMSTANMIARTWLERLKRDALRWNTGATTAAAASLTGTTYLASVPAAATPPAWFTPVPLALATESFAFDHYGRDIAPPSTQIMYCAQTRLQWVYPGQTIRADVRVWWHRESNGSDPNLGNRSLYANCGVGNETAIGNDIRVRTVSASTLIRWVPR